MSDLKEGLIVEIWGVNINKKPTQEGKAKLIKLLQKEKKKKVKEMKALKRPKKGSAKD